MKQSINLRNINPLQVHHLRELPLQTLLLIRMPYNQTAHSSTAETQVEGVINVSNYFALSPLSSRSLSHHLALVLSLSTEPNQGYNQPPQQQFGGYQRKPLFLLFLSLLVFLAEFAPLP